MERKQKARRRGRRRASLVPISLAVYFRPWQSAGMEVPWWWWPWWRWLCIYLEV